MAFQNRNSQPHNNSSPPIGVIGPRNFIFFPLASDKTKPYILNEKNKMPIENNQ